MTSEQKLELVRCYQQDLADAAALDGTSVEQQECRFIEWLSTTLPHGHVTYYTGRVDGVMVTLFRAVAPWRFGEGLNFASRATMRSLGFIQTPSPVPNHDRWRSRII